MNMSVISCSHRIFKIPLKGIKNRTIFLSHQCTRKKKEHWHALATKKNPVDKALEHFDDFYKSLFRMKWPSVRLALLSQPKYVALVNNFGNVEETQNMLINLGAMNINTLFQIYKRNTKSDNAMENRSKALDNAFTLDTIMEKKLSEKEESDINFLYPDGTGDKLRGLIFSGNKEAPLAQDLSDGIQSQNDYNSDYSRVIDPELGLDSGSLHEFIPATKLKGMDDYVAEAEYYSYYKAVTDIPIETEQVYDFKYPKHLKVFTFDRGVVSDYPQPKKTSSGVFNYYLMDGASLLPVLVLGVEPNDRILDMCSGPGGKALTILQSLTPDLLVCNDVTQARVNRIHSVFSQFLYDYKANWNNMLTVQQNDGASLDENNLYNKILVDVPCTNDRLSLRRNENNIFHANRVKERLRIPEKQAALLMNALRIIKPGGAVVYSTCSLSPVQNEGVVGMALRKLWEEQRLEFIIQDFTPALQCTSHFFNYGKNIGMKYGHLVVPFLPSNFGPMYFCRIVKKNRSM